MGDTTEGHRGARCFPRLCALKGKHSGFCAWTGRIIRFCAQTRRGNSPLGARGELCGGGNSARAEGEEFCTRGDGDSAEGGGGILHARRDLFEHAVELMREVASANVYNTVCVMSGEGLWLLCMLVWKGCA